MIAEQDIRTAVLETLRAEAGLAGVINGIYDGAPLRAAVPYAVIGDVTGNDWGTKDAAGRELLITLSLYDRGESAVRLTTLASLVHAAMLALPRTLGGWQVASILPMRSRLVRGVSGNGASAAGTSGTANNGPVGSPFSWQSEWRLRVLAV